MRWIAAAVPRTPGECNPLDYQYIHGLRLEHGTHADNVVNGVGSDLRDDSSVDYSRCTGQENDGNTPAQDATGDRQYVVTSYRRSSASVLDIMPVKPIFRG